MAPDDDAPAKCLQKFNFLQKLNFSGPDKSGAAPKPIHRQSRLYERKPIPSKTTFRSAGVSPFRAPDSSGGVVVKAWLQPGVTLQNRLKPPLQPRIVTRYAAPLLTAAVETAPWAAPDKSVAAELRPTSV